MLEDKELCASAQEKIESLRALMIEKMEPYSPRSGQKLVRLSVVFRQALLHRMVDLASAAISMFRESRLIPGCALTRSLYETVAQLHYFYKKLAAAVETEQLEEITNHVVRGSWGSKDGSTKHEAIQILTAIKHFNKEFPGVEAEYFHLCEYAHPNMKGGIGTYTRIELATYDVEFGINPQALDMGTFGLVGLDIILQITKDLYDRHTNMESMFREVVYRNAPGMFID